MPSKVTILFFGSNPEETDGLRLDEEIRSITQRLRASEYRDTLELVSRWAVRPDDLLQELNTVKPEIVPAYDGHGTRTGELLLMNDSRRLSKSQRHDLNGSILGLPARYPTRRPLDSRCYSAEQADAIAKVIDCVIGMND